jgi:MOSC domain-containing protein YiiM
MTEFAPRLLQIRIGKLQPAENYKEKLGAWPEEIPSAYWKENVEEVEIDANGPVGNEIGHPVHIQYAQDRAVLVYNVLTTKLLKEKFPEHDISIGDMGENFVVDHPSLTPEEVCVGDVFQIGTAKFFVTGPRKPCPKIDAAQQFKGVTNCTNQNGWAGYFFRVLQTGHCKVGDEFVLISRPNPGYNIQRISRGIWGKPEEQENSVEFLSALANMDGLMERGYKDTAKARLDRVLCLQGEN